MMKQQTDKSVMLLISRDYFDVWLENQKLIKYIALITVLVISGIVLKHKLMSTTTTQPSKPQQSIFMSLFKPFIIGSISGCAATVVIQPIDTVKVVIQGRREAAGKTKINLSPFHVGRELIEKNGLLSLYKGLDSALMRQVVYTGIRLGLYRAFEDDIKYRQKRFMTFGQKVGYSMLAGLIGAAIANPLDMSLIRFQADNNLPPAERRNYKNVFDALMQMKQELGFTGMWRGSIPTITRAMALNSFTLVSYNEAKEKLQHWMNQTKETTAIRLIGSAISGVSASIGSLPFDNIKVKILKMKKGPDGTLPYKGIADCFLKTVRNEGFLSLWVGIQTYYFRVAPLSMISILVQDYLHDHFGKKKE